MTIFVVELERKNKSHKTEAKVVFTLPAKREDEAVEKSRRLLANGMTWQINKIESESGGN